MYLGSILGMFFNPLPTCYMANEQSHMKQTVQVFFTRKHKISASHIGMKTVLIMYPGFHHTFLSLSVSLSLQPLGRPHGVLGTDITTITAVTTTNQDAVDIATTALPTGWALAGAWWVLQTSAVSQTIPPAPTLKPHHSVIAKTPSGMCMARGILQHVA